MSVRPRQLVIPGSDGAISFQEAVEFIWYESSLLDQRDFQSWLSLWSDDGKYIIPIDRGSANPADSLNIAYDDSEMRKARVQRLESGLAMSSAPAARTVRTVSRFMTVESDVDMITLSCAQHLVEYKFERTRIVSADVVYRLVRNKGELALQEKRIRLINCDEALFGIGYLL